MLILIIIIHFDSCQLLQYFVLISNSFSLKLNSIMVQVDDLNFLLKLIAMIINLIILLIWVTSDGRGDTSYSRGSAVLFLLANCGYVIVLCIFVALYFLDEIPGQWCQRLFIGTGFIIFLVVGIIGVFDGNRGNALIISFLCILVGGLLLADFFKSESVWWLINFTF